MMKKSNILITITLIVLFLIVSSTSYTIFLMKYIEHDAKTINDLGFIRGSVQRVSKLELAKNPNEKIILSIDKKILDYKIKFPDSNLYDQVSEIEILWVDLKELLVNFRESPTIDNKNLLLTKSEELWTKTDNTVMIAQLLAERKLDYFRNLILLSLLSILLIFLTYYLIRKYVKNKLEFYADHDALTRIYNRKYFNELLKYEINRSQRYNSQLSLIVFDIDKFKNINDTHGHDIGDKILKEVTDVVDSNIRSTDIFARIGGDEFAIITPNTNIKNAYYLAERIRTSIQDHEFIILYNTVEKITLSLGISNMIPNDNIDSIYTRADKMLYKSKENGRNKVTAENLSLDV